MSADHSTESPPIEHAETPPAKLVAAFGAWEAALRAARTRKQLCYSLCSVVLGIVLVLVLYSVFVYLLKVGSIPPPSSGELADLRYYILTRSMMIVGVSIPFFALWGLIHVIWIRNHHEKAVQAIRHEAEKKGWADSLAACGGKLDMRRAQSHWQTYQQSNLRFKIAYQIAIGIGLILAIVGALLR